jgi:hypothetical protein
MPCRYDPSPEELELERKELQKKEDHKNELARIKRKALDETTALLCEAVKLIDPEKLNQHQNLLSWKEAHDIADAKRMEKKRQLKARDFRIGTHVCCCGNENKKGTVLSNQLRQGDEVVAIEWDDSYNGISTENVNDLIKIPK